MELEEVVGVELVVGKVAEETIESVLPGPKRLRLLSKLPKGSCLRSHTASARGTGVGCRDMMMSGRCSARLPDGMRGEWGVRRAAAEIEFAPAKFPAFSR